ncbi:MAG: GNAT family N-acetyltransferase [Bacteroidia bacterium]|nr:GNAT family N-acetyltransferase [Bacteroidia bacterium]
MFLEEKLDRLKEILSPDDLRIPFNEFYPIKSRIEAAFMSFENPNFHLNGWKERLKNYELHNFNKETFDFLAEKLPAAERYWWVFMEDPQYAMSRHMLFDASQKGGEHLSYLFHDSPIFIVDKKYRWLLMIDRREKYYWEKETKEKFPQISSKDLILNEMNFLDAQAYSDILSEPETWHYLTESGPVDLKAAEEKIERNSTFAKEGKAFYWAIRDHRYQFLGYIAVFHLNEERAAISYGIHPDFRRKTFASKALKLILKWEGLAEKELELATHLDNEASYQLLTKMGLSYQGILARPQGSRHVFIRKKG